VRELPVEPGPFWDGNIRALWARYPALAEQLVRRGSARGEELRIEVSAAGTPTLILAGRYVHSPRDPVREGRRLAESLPPGPGPALILGFGLGYAVEAVAEQGRPLIILERRWEVFKKALETRDLRRLLEERQPVFVLGGESGAVSGVLALFKGSPGILRNRALMDLDRDWYAGVERQIQAWQSREGVNQATLRRFGRRWVRNLSANMEAIRDLPGVSRLEGLLAGGGPPVFLAAAGPSLEEAGPFLGEIARRCLVVAVDTSLRFLQSAGVEPDFVVAVDPQYWNFRHLDGAPAPRSRLVAESAVYPAVLRHPFGEAFLAGSLFPLGRFIEDRVDPKGNLGAGGSVATTAWDFARLLGAGEIVSAGLDLAFPGLKTHFRGARFEEKALAEAGRLDPAETWSVRSLRDGGSFRAPGAGGEPVLTDQRLSLYAAWFENRFRSFPGIRNLRLGREGLAIGGLESLTPGELLERFTPRREEIEERLGGARAALERDFYPSGAAAERAQRYGAAREALIRGLEEIRAAAVSAAEQAAQGRRGPLDAAGERRLLQELDRCTRLIGESGVKEAAGFLFPPPAELEAALVSPPSEPLRRHLEFSERFYRALAGAAAYPLQLLHPPSS
jgi:hypothetical protein